MKILRAYQLDIIFLYFALLTFLGIALFILEETGVDAHVFEWYAAAPILVFYTLAHLEKARKHTIIPTPRPHKQNTLLLVKSWRNLISWFHIFNPGY
jgi:hypothetical protein